MTPKLALINKYKIIILVSWTLRFISEEDTYFIYRGECPISFEQNPIIGYKILISKNINIVKFKSVKSVYQLSFISLIRIEKMNLCRFKHLRASST